MRNKEEQARREGMAYALRVAKEQGIEALEKDLKLRGAAGIPCPLNKKAFHELVNDIREKYIHYFTVLTSLTLLDEFEFDNEKLIRFYNRFNLKATLIDENYETWNDYIDILIDEAGMEYEMVDGEKMLLIKKGEENANR